MDNTDFRLGDIVETIKGAKFWGEIIAFDNDGVLPGCTVLAIAPGFEGTKHVYPLKQIRRRTNPAQGVTTPDARCSYCKEHGFQPPNLCEDCRAAIGAGGQAVAGCCSSISPCSWQRHHGMDAVCPTCTAAAPASPQPANPAQVTDAKLHPLEAYADSYAQMARMGDGKVYCRSVEIDIRQNMIPVTAAIGAGGQAVEPMKWTHLPDAFPPIWMMKTTIGIYHIEEAAGSDSPAFDLFNTMSSPMGNYEGLDEAQAAAQADYERRILSALSQSHPADERVAEALRGLLEYVDQTICTHDSTHRGGAIWTICDDCGKQWADDEGGFEPYVDAEAVATARAALSATEGR